MHANEAVDSITAPIRGAQRGLPVRALLGQAATLPFVEDNPAGHAAVPTLIHRLGAGVEANTSRNPLAVAFGRGRWRHRTGRGKSAAARRPREDGW